VAQKALSGNPSKFGGFFVRFEVDG
jgi:hypothetical protein